MSTVKYPPAEPDLGSPEVAACPYAFYDKARAATPAYRIPSLDAFLVTRFDDVYAAARDPKSFTSRRPRLAAGDPEFEEIRAKGYRAVPVLATCDPPEHTRHRKLVNKPFTPVASGRYEPLIRQTVTDLIDGFIADGNLELMSQFAVPFSTRVIGSILGVTDAGLANFGRWADNIAEISSGYVQRERALECARGIMEMKLYFTDLIEERRQRPADDLVSALVTAREDVERSLDVLEILELIGTFVAGGTESTASLLGSTLYLLLTHPDQFEQVRADHSLIPQMIEEVLRLESPVQWNPRMVMTEGVTVGEVAIPIGSRVMLGWGAANRDPQRFGPEADRFDIFRKGPQHAAFGHAYHFCLGAPLARLEARIACEQLFSRLSDIELAVPVEQLSFVAHGVVRRLESVPLRFTAAGAS